MCRRLLCGLCVAAMLYPARALPLDHMWVGPADNMYACRIMAPPNELAIAHVYYRSYEGTVTGAEFRITGFPEQWALALTPHPEATAVIGDAFEDPGINFAAPVCIEGNELVLATITIYATTTVSDKPILIEARNPPTNVLFSCPLITLCDAPVFTKRCVTSFPTLLNGSYDPCSPAVESTTWTEVKELFRG